MELQWRTSDLLSLPKTLECAGTPVPAHCRLVSYMLKVVTVLTVLAVTQV